MARKKFKEKEAGVYLGHCACPKCESTDAGSYYEHEDGSYSFSCFSAGCGHSIVDFDIENMKPAEGNYNKREIDWEVELEKLEEVRDGLIAVSNKERKISADLYELYGCRMEMDEEGKKIQVIYYPTYRMDENDVLKHVGYRNRKRFTQYSKEVQKDPSKLGVLKDFAGGIGDTKKGIAMFGQWLFKPEDHKRIIICCGEEDALASYKMTSMHTKFDGGYPSVSVPSGENVNGVKPHLEYLSKFEEIYIVADQDDAGMKFQNELCKILPVGKVKKVKLPDGIKDPSQLWSKTKSDLARKSAAKKFWNALWNAEKYSPVGIMSLSEGWKNYMNRGKDTLIPFPDAFGELNAKTHGGAALGEIVNIIAPSSVGKTSFVKESLYNALMQTDYNIGVLSLEETIDEFIEGFLSIHMSTQLNEIPFDMRDRKAEYDSFQEIIHYHPKVDTEDGEVTIDTEDKTERIHFLDHQGACSGEDLLEKVDFMVNGLDCKIIVLDPVTLACSGSDTDEDEMASEIVKRVKRHKLLWFNVHHVRKNSNGSTANSEGGDLAEEDIKGTGAWFQVGMINLIFTRNKVHEDPIVRNTTKIKMSKCRRHGKNTGIVGYTYYNGETGRLELGQNIEEYLETNKNFDLDEEPLNSFE